MVELDASDFETLKGIQAYGGLVIVTHRCGLPVPGAASAMAWAESLCAEGLLLHRQPRQAAGLSSVAYGLTPTSDRLLLSRS
ncbi:MULTISPECIES: hypothetical protein [Phenylobacterium]|uniref:Uncharacterized protein n=1 Tax=Phenylobacterium koreense TaxID=266125 RepID=A0ABV2EHC0_9CAUL